MKTVLLGPPSQEVEELLIVDPTQRSVDWYVRGVAGFEIGPASPLLGLRSAELAAAIAW